MRLGGWRDYRMVLFQSAPGREAERCCTRPEADFILVVSIRARP